MSEPTYEELAEFFRNHNLSQAHAHDIEGAKAIFRVIAKDLEAGTLKGVYKQWIIQALKQIAAGEDANKVLLVAGAKGRDYPRELATYRRNYLIWHKMNNLKQETPSLSFKSASDILELDSPDLGLSAQAIRKAYREFTKQPAYENPYQKLHK